MLVDSYRRATEEAVETKQIGRVIITQASTGSWTFPTVSWAHGAALTLLTKAIIPTD